MNAALSIRVLAGRNDCCSTRRPASVFQVSPLGSPGDLHRDLSRLKDSVLPPLSSIGMPALSRYHNAMSVRRELRVLFFVEGFTDIRFVVGLSEICELTMVVPGAPYRESGLERARRRERREPARDRSRGRPARVPVPVAGRALAARRRVRRHPGAGGAARLAQRQPRRRGSAACRSSPTWASRRSSTSAAGASGGRSVR